MTKLQRLLQSSAIRNEAHRLTRQMILEQTRLAGFKRNDYSKANYDSAVRKCLADPKRRSRIFRKAKRNLQWCREFVNV